MSIWVGHYEPLELFCLCTEVHQFSFAQRGSSGGLWSFFSDVRYVEQFRGYSRSKSKVVRYRDEIWTFFWPSQIFWGEPSKSCTRVINPASRHVVWRSFVSILPPAQKFLRLIRWILSLILNFRDQNFLGGPPSQLGCVLGSLGQSLARLKISGRSTP